MLHTFEVDITTSAAYAESMMRISRDRTQPIDPKVIVRHVKFSCLPSIEKDPTCFVCRVFTGEHTTSLLFMSSSWYFVGFRLGDKDIWQLFQTNSETHDQIILAYIKLDTPDQRNPIPGEDFKRIPIKVDYNTLEKTGKNRMTVSLGYQSLVTAINDLRRSRDPVTISRGCIVVIQMFSEALRFNILFAGIIQFYGNIEQFKIDLEIRALENNWDKISAILYEYATTKKDKNPETETHQLDPDVSLLLRRMLGVVSAILPPKT